MDIFFCRGSVAVGLINNKVRLLDVKVNLVVG